MEQLILIASCCSSKHCEYTVAICLWGIWTFWQCMMIRARHSGKGEFSEGYGTRRQLFPLIVRACFLPLNVNGPCLPFHLCTLSCLAFSATYSSYFRLRSCQLAFVSVVYTSSILLRTCNPLVSHDTITNSRNNLCAKHLQRSILIALRSYLFKLHLS